MVNSKLKIENYIGNTLLQNLSHIKSDVLYENYDCVGVVAGGEGKGKSNVGAILGCFFSPDTFSEKWIALEEEEGDQLLDKVDYGQTAILDEGTEMLYSKEGMTRKVRNREKKITQMRGRNAFLWICISDLKMLARYIRMSRALMLIVCKERGILYIYNLENRNVKKLVDKIEVGEYPKPDFVDWIKPLCHISSKVKCRDCTKKPCYNLLWRNYNLKKDKFMRQTKKNKALLKLEEKTRKKLKGSLTISEIAQANKVSYVTARKYVRLFVSKRDLFKDFNDIYRVTPRGLKMLEKRWKKRLNKLNKLKK